MKKGDRIICRSNPTLILEVLLKIGSKSEVVCKQKGRSLWAKDQSDIMRDAYYDTYFKVARGQEKE